MNSQKVRDEKTAYQLQKAGKGYYKKGKEIGRRYAPNSNKRGHDEQTWTDTFGEIMSISWIYH